MRVEDGYASAMHGEWIFGSVGASVDDTTCAAGYGTSCSDMEVRVCGGC